MQATDVIQTQSIWRMADHNEKAVRAVQLRVEAVPRVIYLQTKKTIVFTEMRSVFFSFPSLFTFLTNFMTGFIASLKPLSLLLCLHHALLHKPAAEGKPASTQVH